jgi:hypothetical protein
MSIQLIPQGADIRVIFEDLQYNTDPTEIDLDDMDDFIVSIAYKGPNYTPFLTIRYSDTPAKFSIDNSLKKVSVNILSSEITEELGIYCINLWLEKDGLFVTHFVEYLKMMPTVDH